MWFDRAAGSVIPVNTFSSDFITLDVFQEPPLLWVSPASSAHSHLQICGFRGFRY